MNKTNAVVIKDLVATIDGYLIWNQMSALSAKQHIGMLVFGLKETRDQLIGIYRDEVAEPWCCHLECEERATWLIVHGPSPDDNTQACDAHLADLLCDHNEVSPISRSMAMAKPAQDQS